MRWYLVILAGSLLTNIIFGLTLLVISAYLSRDNSNELLEIMTTSPYNDKIVAGVPADVKVAHKIGIYRSQNNPTETYSDCGIVYVPQRPYILCVMTNASTEKAREYLQEISKMVYGYVSAVKGGM